MSDFGSSWGYRPKSGRHIGVMYAYYHAKCHDNGLHLHCRWDILPRTQKKKHTVNDIPSILGVADKYNIILYIKTSKNLTMPQTISHNVRISLVLNKRALCCLLVSAFVMLVVHVPILRALCWMLYIICCGFNEIQSNIYIRCWRFHGLSTTSTKMKSPIINDFCRNATEALQ